MTRRHAWFALGVMAPVGLVAFGVVLTTQYGIAACPLCVVQRMLYLAIALVAFIGLLASGRVIAYQAASAMATLSVAGAVSAGYQIYLQHHPFAATCGSGTAWWERLVDQAGQALPMLFKADGLCSDNAWSLFGLSIVEWSLVAFSGFFLLAILAIFTVASDKKKGRA